MWTVYKRIPWSHYLLSLWSIRQAAAVFWFPREIWQTRENKPRHDNEAISPYFPPNCNNSIKSIWHRIVLCWRVGSLSENTETSLNILIHYLSHHLTLLNHLFNFIQHLTASVALILFTKWIPLWIKNNLKILLDRQKKTNKTNYTPTLKKKIGVNSL